REQLRAFLSSQAPAAPSEPPTAAERGEIDAVVRDANGGKLSDAWKRVWPLLQKRPDDPAIQRLGCQVASALPPPFPERALDTTCRRAVELSGDDGAVWLLVWADAMARAHVEARADELLGDAERR